MSKNRFLSRRKNLLIVSDLHLGEGLREATDGSIPRRDAGADGRDQYLERLEREFSAFLIHYTIERIQGRPWRLIINGDMVDFMSIILLPGIAPQLATPEELVAAAIPGTKIQGARARRLVNTSNFLFADRRVLRGPGLLIALPCLTKRGDTYQQACEQGGYLQVPTHVYCH